MNQRPELLRKRTAYYCLGDWQDFSHFSALMDRALAPCYFGYGGQYRVQSGAGYHLPNRQFLEYLKGVSAQLGIEHVDGDVVQAQRDQDGNVSALLLDDGRQVEGDLMIDCSGFRSYLLHETMGVPKVSYANSLFCDRAAVGSWNNEGDTVLPYTTAETMDHGWCWRIDFDDHVTRGYVFSSRFCDDNTAIDELRRKNPRIGQDVRVIGFDSGRFEEFWKGNVVAIGNSSGFVEPLEATALHLIAQQLTSVCGVLLDSDQCVAAEVVREENRQFRRAWDEVRDFLALHYKFNYRADTPFWRHCQQETDLGGAEALVDMYRVVGPHRSCEGLIPLESMFRYDGYLSMLIGQRVPTAYRPDFLPQDYTDWHLYRDRVRADVAQAVPIRHAYQVVHSPNWKW
jgi:tryptophan halogenase